MIHVSIGGNTYAAIVDGCIANARWDGRDTKTVTLVMDHATAAEIFVDGAKWKTICEYDDPETGEHVIEECDCSEYCIAGNIIDHRDGTLSVVMGKETALEQALELLYGGNEE